MLTPLDIQNKEFAKSFRGYKETEVDMFLDEIITDYESLYKENIELKDKIASMTEQIKQYNNLEDTLKNTLVIAQGTAEEVTNTAKQKSELIILEAEGKAKRIIEDAHDEVIKIQGEYENLRKEIYIFKTKFKSLIEGQLISLENYYEEIEKATNNSFSSDVVEEDKDDCNRIDDMGA